MNSCGFQQDADNNVSPPPQPTLTNKYDTRKFNNNNNCKTSNTHTKKFCAVSVECLNPK